MAYVKPRAVIEAEERAEKLHRESYPDQYEGMPPTNDGISESVPTPPEEVIAPAEEPTEQPTPPETPETPTPVAEPDLVERFRNLEADLEKERHRNDVLKGKYEHEVVEVQRQNRDLSARLTALEEEATRKAVETVPVAAGKLELRIAKEDEENVKFVKGEFPEIHDAIIAISFATCQQVFRKEFAPVQKKIDELHFGSQEDLESKKETFYTELRKKYPTWEKIQTSPEFGMFMLQKDELTDIPRWKIFQTAVAKWDISKVLKIFDLFMIETDRKTAPSRDSITEDRKALLTGPGGKPSGSPPNPPPKPKVSQAEARKKLDEFYQEVRKGKWKGREAERDKEEARLVKLARGQ